MSDISALKNGKLTLTQFVEKVGGEFASNPFTKMLAPMLLTGLEVELTGLTKSPTAAELIVTDIAHVIAGQPISLSEDVSELVASTLGLPTPATEPTPEPTATFQAGSL